MPEAFTLGPLLIPTRAMGFVLLALLALWLVRRIATRMEADADFCVRIAEQSLWIGLVASRLVFALLNWQSYAAKPWTVLYFWQPGYAFSPGLIAALIYLFIRISRQQESTRRTLINSLIAGFTLPILLFTSMLLTMNRFVAKEIFIPGDTVPTYLATDIDGAQVSLADYRGKGLIINFWATWCPPCRREMPLLERTYQKYKSQNIAMIGITVDESMDIVKNYVQSVGVSYPIWENALSRLNTGVSRGRFSQLFGIVGFPTTFFVDADGVIQSSYVGELNQALLDKRITALIPQDRKGSL